MKQLRWLVVVSVLLLFFTGPLSAEVAVFDPVQDASTNEQIPYATWGVFPYMDIGEWSEGFDNIGWIEFDLDTLPHGTVIDQLDLELTIQNHYQANPFDLEINIVDFPWDELTITWENQPPIGAPMTTWSGNATGETIVIPIPPEYGWQWMEGPDVTHGMALQTPNYEAITVPTKEDPGDVGPKLHVTYHVLPPAVIELTPPEITMGFAYGDPEIGDGVVDGSFTIQNTGQRELEWSLNDDVDWMSCAPVADDLNPGESQSIDIWIDEWPGAGTQVGTITISDPNADPPSVDLAVTLTCYQAQLVVDPAEVDLFWSSYDPEVSVDFDVQNPGDLDLNWSLAESADWMVCSPTSGTVAPGSSETVTVTTDTWPGEGTFSDFITITDPNALPTEAEVEVTLVCVDAPAELTLYPPSDPVLISPGASFEYDAQLESYLDFPVDVDVWTQALLPNGNTMNIWRVDDVSLAPNASILVEDLIQAIPGYAPAGEYTFYMRAGYYPNYVAVEDEFGITVQGSAIDGGSDGWQAIGYDQFPTSSSSETMLAGSDESLLPDKFSLDAAYPNPFNPSTTLRVNLPETVELNVSVYNVTGQLVATLATGSYDAGSHILTFDASHLSGGVYFVQAMAGGWKDVQKVVLMK